MDINKFMIQYGTCKDSQFKNFPLSFNHYYTIVTTGYTTSQDMVGNSALCITHASCAGFVHHAQNGWNGYYIAVGF